MTRRTAFTSEIGGLGGNLSEIGRRFILTGRQQELYNPPETRCHRGCLTLLFQDFQHGDPYARYLKGAMRFPGAGCELTQHVPGVRLRMAASSVGKTMPWSSIHQTERATEQYGEYVTDIGTFHKYYERLRMRRGILRKET